MDKNETYYEKQLVELYKVVYIPLKTETHTWRYSLVSSGKRAVRAVQFFQSELVE